MRRCGFLSRRSTWAHTVGNLHVLTQRFRVRDCQAFQERAGTTIRTDDATNMLTHVLHMHWRGGVRNWKRQVAVLQ